MQNQKHHKQSSANNMAKQIDDLKGLLEDINVYLSADPRNRISPDSVFHHSVKMAISRNP
jgi:hypothetical protein